MKVLYFSGVTPVELSAGYSLMHRHLGALHEDEVFVITRDYPPARALTLPHRGIRISEPSRLYHRITAHIGDPLFWLEREASRLRRVAKPHALSFWPEVILTVWEAPYVLAAADLSEDLKLPLVVMFHDDAEEMMPPYRNKRVWADSRLRAIYQKAAARIAVGPGMQERLSDLYGDAPSSVVYPIPRRAPHWERLPRGEGDVLRIVFFGELGGNYQVIHALVDLLEEVNAELHIFSHSTGIERKQVSMRPHVIDHGQTNSIALQEYIRREIDLILIPQGFDLKDRLLRRTCFPSKIPEACQTGLPILVVSPPDGSAMRWARNHLESAVYVDTLDRTQLAKRVGDFRNESFRERQRQCIAAIRDGMFSPDSLQHQFEEILRSVALRKPSPTSVWR